MITQAKIKLQKTSKSELNSALGAKIHGCLLNSVSTELGAKLHAFGEVRPFSLYVLTDDKDFDWLVLNILHDNALELLDVLKEMDDLPISGLKRSIAVYGIESITKRSSDEIFEAPKDNVFRLNFKTPTTYKINNQYSNWFDLSRLIMGPIMKLNTLESMSINPKDFHGINECVDILNYHLKSVTYLINGNYINSFIGEVTCRVTGSTAEAKLLKSILNYCEYSGIGAKTAMGMGGFALKSRQ